MKIHEQFKLENYNSFRLRSTCQYFVELESENDISELLNLEIFKSSKKYFVLGGGSNVLLPSYYEGLVLYPNFKGISEIYDDEDSIILSVAAGEYWFDLIEYTLTNQCYGLENLTLIPGKVGASPIQNIGAYGVEVKQFIESVNVFDFETLEFLQLSNEACEFSYRDSIFKRHPRRYLIISVEYRLMKKPDFQLGYPSLQAKLEAESIDAHKITHRQVSDLVKSIRLKRLPNPEIEPNTGSFFKNPIVSSAEYETLKKQIPNLSGYSVEDLDSSEDSSLNPSVKLSAAQLIDECGLKGESVGNVSVSTLHALVLVSNGTACIDEVNELRSIISERVFKRFGVNLEVEPVFIN